jgi:Sigma-70 region 2
MPLVRWAFIPLASSRAQSLRICRSCSQPSSSWSSTPRPPGCSASATSTANDLEQETLLRAIANINSLHPGSHMSAWLITIPRNLSRSEYRKRRREVEDADGRHVDSLKSPPQQQSGWNSRNFVWRSRSCPPASGGSASRRRAGLLPRRGGYDLRERGRDDQRAGSIVPARDSRSCSPSTGRQVRPRPHDACRSDRRRARSAARLGGCHFPRRCVGHNRRARQLNSTRVLFSDFRPRSLVCRDPPALHLETGIAYNRLCPHPLRSKKGRSLYEEQGSLCEEERQDLVRSQRISRQGGRGQNDIKISEGSNRFLTGTSRGRGFLHPAGSRSSSPSFPSKARKR